MATLVAVLVCVAIVAISELVRFGVARALRLPIAPVAKVFVGFRGGPRWRRVVAIASGTVATYLAVVAVAFAFYSVHGVRTTDLECVVESVVEGYPAYGKLEVGDRIVAIDGAPFERSPSAIIDAANGAPVRLTFYRGGISHEVTITPVGKDGHWVVGFRPELRHGRTYLGGRAIELAFETPIESAKHLFPDPPPPSADPGGPKRIYDEYEVNEPRSVFSMMLRFSVYVLLLVVFADLARIVRALTRRD